jgi:hypothetical protein
MQRTIGAEAEAVFAERDVTGIVAIEIFAKDLIGPLAHAASQSVSDIDAFSRDTKGHADASILLP